MHQFSIIVLPDHEVAVTVTADNVNVVEGHAATLCFVIEDTTILQERNISVLLYTQDLTAEGIFVLNLTDVELIVSKMLVLLNYLAEVLII